MSYIAAWNRYETMLYRQCGKSGLKLPAFARLVAQLRWHDAAEKQRTLLRTAST
jgi:hypothetical protein